MLAQASAQLPEVKSGRDEGVGTPRLGGGWGRLLLLQGAAYPSAPLRGWEALALLGEGLVLVPEVMAAGGGSVPTPPPPPLPRLATVAPHPAEEKGGLLAT